MSTSAPAMAPRHAVATPAWLGLALAFAIGTASGAVATTVIVQRAIVDGSPAVAVTTSEADLTSLVSKADAAASRGDVRLFIQFRDDLAARVGSAAIADQLTHLAAKADAAASRGDTRLAIQFREDLAASIAAIEGE